MRRRYRSYLRRKEESRNIKKAIALMISTIAIGLLIIFFGLPAIINFSSLIANLRKSNTPVEANDTTPPITPRFSSLPEETNNSRIELSGSTEPGAFVTIDYEGKEQEVIANANGIFNLIITLKEGENIIKAYSKDAAGNKSAEVAMISIKFDNTPPEFENESPKEGTTFYGSKQRQISIAGQTEIDSQISVNDRFVLVEENGAFNYTLTLTDGENKFNVKAMDAAGNSSEKELTLFFTP